MKEKIEVSEKRVEEILELITDVFEENEITEIEGYIAMTSLCKVLESKGFSNKTNQSALS